MSQQELLTQAVRAMERAGVEYMLTGSLVSSLQGEPRSTHDIDIVIAIRRPEADLFYDFLRSEEFYLDKESMVEAVESGRMFNLIDMQEGEKVDFWILSEEPFDLSRFGRRYIERIAGMDLYVTRPEDTILSKLRWAKLAGGSEKQFTDALRVYEVQFPTLDADYLRYWAKELEIVELWKRLENQAVAI